MGFLIGSQFARLICGEAFQLIVLCYFITTVGALVWYQTSGFRKLNFWKKCHKTIKFLHFYGLCCGLHTSTLLYWCAPLTRKIVKELDQIWNEDTYRTGHFIKCIWNRTWPRSSIVVSVHKPFYKFSLHRSTFWDFSTKSTIKWLSLQKQSVKLNWQTSYHLRFMWASCKTISSCSC